MNRIYTHHNNEESVKISCSHESHTISIAKMSQYSTPILFHLVFRTDGRQVVHATRLKRVIFANNAKIYNKIL